MQRHDECVLATMESVLKSKKIQLTGGTAWEGLVCCNGQVYEDVCAYALVKNESGRVKVYKENIYLRKDAVKHIVTRSEPRTYTIQEIDGRRAEDVYTKELGISPENITEQTMVNPLGRVIGDETYIISIKERTGNGSFSCYRKVNPKDNICFYRREITSRFYRKPLKVSTKIFQRFRAYFR